MRVLWPQVRLCPEHALQLNHRKNQEAMRQQRKALKREQCRKGGRDSDGGGEGGLHADVASSGRKRQRAGNGGAAAPASCCFTLCSNQACSEAGKLVVMGLSAHMQKMKGTRGSRSTQGTRLELMQLMVRVLQQRRSQRVRERK